MDLAVVPQLIVPTLALFGEKEDSARRVFLWQGWWLAGCARHWVEQAWQLRVLQIAGAWYIVHTQQDPWGRGKGQV
jgi:hypothetical protein